MTANPHQPTLILWDIDRTLVTTGEVSREIYARAFEEIVGQPLRELADMAGRTEQAILVDTLSLHGVTNPESSFDDFYAALAVAADKLRERMRVVGNRLPGAEKALAALAKPNVVQTVVTGNIKPIAVTKLEVFHLSGYIDFEVGGYGSDSDTRPPLILQAWQRAQHKYGQVFAADRVAVIGDTPLDVAAAREVGVRAIGVATGSSGIEDLMAAQADTVLPDLTDTEAVIRALCPGAPRAGRSCPA
ncbi:MAG: haloacid dehalogenase-like hydrolase [Pseudonocardiales bacterium]|nr:haloacid dehalogenase-like hydrolase [Pseudonocardiales bacterium]